MKCWIYQKMCYLIDMIWQFEQIVLVYQNVGDVLIVCNIFVMLVFKFELEVWFVQNYDDFFVVYDYVVLMVMLYMEQVKDFDGWFDQFVKVVCMKQCGLQCIVFELQVYDWYGQKVVLVGMLFVQMWWLCSEGVVNFGYYFDNFLNGQFEFDVMCDVMLLKLCFDFILINVLMQMQQLYGIKML